MKISTNKTLKMLYIFAWIIFILLCISAGTFITDVFFVLASPASIDRFWLRINLLKLFKYHQWHFLVMTLTIGIIEIAKMWLFYLIIKMLHKKNVDITHPFNDYLLRFISKLSTLTLLIGLFSTCGNYYIDWLIMKNEIEVPQFGNFYTSGADAWLLMSVVFFVIAQIFKKGIELQQEQDLTI